MKALTALAIAATLSFSGAAFADADLAKKNACIGCHDATAKKLGPTWTAIAAKHKGDKDAEAKLVAAINNGSKGVYGKIPMPKQAKAGADAAALAKWIMTH